VAGVEDRAGLVVGAARPRAAERLLADHCALSQDRILLITRNILTVGTVEMLRDVLDGVAVAATMPSSSARKR
jgi:hypothetical protein